MLGDDSIDKILRGAGIEEGGATPEAPMQNANQSERSQLHEFFYQIYSADTLRIKQGIMQGFVLLDKQDLPLVEFVKMGRALPRLRQLLEHPDEVTRRSAAVCAMKMVNDISVKCLLFQSQPPPPFEAVLAALPVCYQLMQHSDTEVQAFACFAVSYISHGSTERAIACQNAGLIPIAVELLRTQRPSVVLPAIRIVVNFATISAHAVQTILDMGVLQLMGPLMQSHVNLLIRKYCCMLLCGVAAGTHAQVQAVLDSGLMPLVVRWMSDPDLKEEAIHIVSNIGACGTPDQVRATVEHFNCVSGVCAALRTGDSKTCSSALEICEALLTLGDARRTTDHIVVDPTQTDAATTDATTDTDPTVATANNYNAIIDTDPTETDFTETDFPDTRGVNPYVALFADHGIVQILYDLADSQDDQVSRLARRLLHEYFNTSAGSGATGDVSGGDDQPHIAVLLYGGQELPFSEQELIHIVSMLL